LLRAQPGTAFIATWDDLIAGDRRLARGYLSAEMSNLGRDVARVHLRILGQDRELELPIRTGAATLDDLLPAARELSRRATEIAVAATAAEGAVISCHAGCGACCRRQLVPISVVEARALARAVDALPPARREGTRARFAAAVRAIEALGLLDPAAPPGRMTFQSTIADPRRGWSDVVARYFAAGIPCPLLEDDRCSLYEERPLVCREYLATSPPERCTELGAARVVPRPIHGSEVLATAVRELTGEPLPMLPLPLALEWSEAAGAVLDQQTDGDNLFNHLIAAADQLAK
jgi:Fe-S-cluster containining protein